MSWFRKTRGGFAALAALVVVIPATPAHAAPIASRITYTTTGPGPISGPTDAPVIEFRGVENGEVATGSDFKLGTFFVHQQEPNTGFTFDGYRAILTFQVSSVNGAPATPNETPLYISAPIYGSVYPDGTVALGASMFHEIATSLEPWKGTGDKPFQVGDLMLTLGPVDGGGVRLWNLTPGTPVTEIDVYGRIEAVPVPEPGTWLVFVGAAAAFAGTRLRRTK